LYLNPKGTIPTTSVIKKGQKRDNPFREKKRFDVTSFPVAGEGMTGTEEQEDEECDETVVDKRNLVDLEG
jgi:tRNA pseudouridine38-40 synthase